MQLRHIVASVPMDISVYRCQQYGPSGEHFQNSGPVEFRGGEQSLETEI